MQALPGVRRKPVPAVLCLLATLALPAAARGEARDGGTSLDLRRPAIELGIDPRPLSFALTATAFTGVDDRRAHGGLGAGVRLGYRGPACRLVDAGAYATFDRNGLGSAEAWASACASITSDPGTVLVFEVTDRGRVAVEPSLTARRVALRGSHSENRASLRVMGPEGPLDAHNRIAIFDVRFEPSFYWLPGGPGGVTQVTEVRVEVGRWHYDSPDGAIGFGAIYVEDHWMGLATGVGGWRVAPLRLLGAGIGPVALDAWPAWGHGSVWPEEPADTEAVHRVDVLAGNVTLRPRRAGRVSWSLELDRDLWPTLARDLVVETRGTAALSVAATPFAASASAFVARTAIYDDDGDAEAALGGGGELRLSRDLGRGVSASFALEAARALESAGDGGPRWSVRSSLLLSATVGR